MNFEPPPADHDDRGDGPLGQIFPDRLVVAAAPGKMGRQASPVSRGHPRVAAGEIDEGRKQVDERDARPDAARRETAGARDDERHARGALEEAHLVPETALAQHLAVVADENDDRVLGEPAGAERLHQPAESVVDERDRAEIGVAGVAHLIVGHRLRVHRVDVAKPEGMRIELGPRDRRRGRLDVLMPVEVPVVLRDGERIVRMGERGDQEEGPPVFRPRDVEDRALGHEGRLLVEIELVGADADPGLGDRAHVVIPARPCFGAVPVRGPAVVGG